MLNGKFFTGLPPKMIERGGGTAPNRLESHLFWPDDTKAESAVECKLKRRNSVQLQASDKPSCTRQFSVGGDNDVDTKRRFSKEFSQSSIQFYDNLSENNPVPNRRALLRSGVGKKTDLTEKPTATKLQLPETIVDEAYTTAKRKQAYMSKIEFYDFVNEQEAEAQAKIQQNNFRKPKMDMNDKREMELNSKNSPKLQIKRDARSLSEEKDMPKINNRSTKTLERPSRQIKEVNLSKANTREYREGRNEIYDRSNVKSRERNNYDSRYDREPVETQYENDGDYYEKPNRSVLPRERFHRKYEDDRDFGENSHQRYKIRDRSEDFVDEKQYRRIQNDTKKDIRSQYGSRTRNEILHRDEAEIGERMRKVRIESSPPRRYHYYRDEYYDDERPVEDNRRTRTSPTRDITKRGNLQRLYESNPRDEYEDDAHPYEDSYEAMNNKSSRNICDNSHQANIDRTTNKLNNEIASRRFTRSPSPELIQKSSTPGASQSPSTMSADVNKPRKHLRSSLCFHDGAIIAENDATQSPTSEKPAARRNIRSTATKRVSVGLPD